MSMPTRGYSVNRQKTMISDTCLSLDYMCTQKKKKGKRKTG